MHPLYESFRSKLEGIIVNGLLEPYMRERLLMRPETGLIHPHNMKWGDTAVDFIHDDSRNGLFVYFSGILGG